MVNFEVGLMNKNSIFLRKVVMFTKVEVVLLAVLLFTPSLVSAKGLPLPELIPYLSQFRQEAYAAPQTAFERYADQSTVTKLGNLGAVLCPLSEPSKGWEFFFGTSIATVASLNEEKVIVMFYNPWADVALLCEWSNPGDSPKMSDAELVMGDVLRKTKKPILIPLWRRVGDVPPPLAITVAASDTVRGFMNIYGKKGWWNSGNWRGKLKKLMKSDDQIEGNRIAVGALFAQALASVNVFFTEEAFKPLKSSMEGVRQMLLKGQTSKVLAIAEETSIESRAILTEIPFEWRRASMVSLVTDPKNAFVFMADFDNPEYFASFWFGMSDDSQIATLRRIDFLGYTLNFEQVKALAKQAGMTR